MQHREGYMPIHPDHAKRPNCPQEIPMSILNEGQAQWNHGQSLKRLAERGGIDLKEALAIIHRKPFSFYGHLDFEEALRRIKEILDVHSNKQKQWNNPAH